MSMTIYKISCYLLKETKQIEALFVMKTQEVSSCVSFEKTETNLSMNSNI